MTSAAFYQQQLAWLDPTNKQNRLVQLAAATPIANCKEYHQKAPKAIVLFYVNYANMTNAETTTTTVLEVWRATREVKIGFQQQKEANVVE